MENEIELKQRRSAFANRLAKARSEPAFRAKQRRELVAAHLGAAIAGLGYSRTKVAQKAKMKPAQLSRQLSGSANLTLDTIGRICDAVGLDFDVVYRLAGHERARQPWERIHSVYTAWHNLQPAFYSTDEKLIDLPFMNVSMVRSRASGAQEVFTQEGKTLMIVSARETVRA